MRVSNGDMNAHIDTCLGVVGTGGGRKRGVGQREGAEADSSSSSGGGGGGGGGSGSDVVEVVDGAAVAPTSCGGRPSKRPKIS